LFLFVFICFYLFLFVFKHKMNNRLSINLTPRIEIHETKPIDIPKKAPFK